MCFVCLLLHGAFFFTLMITVCGEKELNSKNTREEESMKGGKVGRLCVFVCYCWTWVFFWRPVWRSASTHTLLFFFFFSPGGSLVFGSARLAVNHRLGPRLAAMFDLAQPFIRYAHGGEVKVIYQKLQLESEEVKKT